MRTLPQESKHHHELMDPHIDALPALAELIDTVRPEAFAAKFEEEYHFLRDQMVPHIEGIETGLYPELERLMQNRHSMVPMRREHRELLRIIASLGTYRSDIAAGRLDDGKAMALRRALYRLHAIFKVHLAEEEHYLGVLEHNLSPEEKDELARAFDHAMAQPL
jgi:iron-sulfur cluster repair protein YtfE (RIC family)